MFYFTEVIIKIVSNIEIFFFLIYTNQISLSNIQKQLIYLNDKILLNRNYFKNRLINHKLFIQ